jgi:hypothetical protein
MSAGATTGFPGLPRTATLEIVIDFVNRLMIGRLNATRDVTLTASATTTTLTDSRLGPNSFIGFMPQTANAKTALANIYVTGRTKGSATINHASSANTDQTFTVLIVG